MKHATIIKIIQIEFIQMIKFAIDKLLIKLISECRQRLVGMFVGKRQKIEGGRGRERERGGGGYYGQL